MAPTSHRPVALVTGASRLKGIGAAIAIALAEDGWDVGLTSWTAYDVAQPWQQAGDVEPEAVVAAVRAAGARCTRIEADFFDAATPAAVFDQVGRDLGPVTGLVVNHTECVVSGLRDTTIESFDRHYAVNVRAPWLLMRELAQRFPVGAEAGRVVTLTSDHVIGNLPYGATKAAANCVALAATAELAPLGITVNAVNPGGTDTGWMQPEHLEHIAATSPSGVPSTTDDAARLVRWLFSPAGRWINGQLLYSNGGFRSTLT
jgi:3-oxoacyl-[acyl-carrier protein] reductase